MPNHNLVHNEEALLTFLAKVVPTDLDSSESLMVSLAARNKYLTMDERKSTGLGRTEMFAKQILRSGNPDYILSRIFRFNCDERAYTTKLHLPIPSKTVIVYWSINPYNGVEACEILQGKIREMQKSLTGTLRNVIKAQKKKASSKKSEEELAKEAERLTKLQEAAETLVHDHTRLVAMAEESYAQAPTRKVWHDFDFDIPLDQVPAMISLLKEYFCENNLESGNAIFIKTHGGIHVMMKAGSFSRYFNPEIIVAKGQTLLATLLNRECDEAFKKEFEIMHNGNEMVPLVGTLQGDFPVTAEYW